MRLGREFQRGRAAEKIEAGWRSLAAVRSARDVEAVQSRGADHRSAPRSFLQRFREMSECGWAVNSSARSWTGTRLHSVAPAGGVCDRDEHRQKPYRAVSALQRGAASAFTAPIVAQRPWVRIRRRTEAGRAQRAAASPGRVHHENFAPQKRRFHEAAEGLESTERSAGPGRARWPGAPEQGHLDVGVTISES